MTKTISFFLALFLCTVSIQAQDDVVIDHINTYLNELAKDKQFSLSIAISKGDQMVLNRSFGYANRAHEVLNELDTKFNIASIGKLFTATAILQLKEQNKLAFDLPIGHYLPDFPNDYIRDSVTIHQLLTHSAGLPLWFNDTFDRSPKFAYAELKDYLPFYENMPIDAAKVGKKYYSNAGYMVLGFVIEKVAQMSYKDYLNAYIFQPLEMHETNIWQLDEIIPNAAVGYIRPSNKDDYWKTNYHLNKGGSPAGGAYASSGDLIKFQLALQSNQVLQEATKDLMLSPQIETAYGHYGYGIALTENNGQATIGHLGGYYGVRGELIWYKDADYTVSILANSDQTDYLDVSHFIKTELTGTPADKAAHQSTLNLLQSKEFAELEKHTAWIRSLKENQFDETLIQIKGYYHYNNQDYEKAKNYFWLNTILFPESRSAQKDFTKVSERL